MLTMEPSPKTVVSIVWELFPYDLLQFFDRRTCLHKPQIYALRRFWSLESSRVASVVFHLIIGEEGWGAKHQQKDWARNWEEKLSLHYRKYTMHGYGQALRRARVKVFFRRGPRKHQGPNVRGPISTNLGLNFNPDVFFSLSITLSWIISSILFRLFYHQIVDEKD